MKYIKINPADNVAVALQDRETFEGTVRLINDFKEYFMRQGMPVYPGGLTSMPACWPRMSRWKRFQPALSNSSSTRLPVLLSGTMLTATAKSLSSSRALLYNPLRILEKVS